MVGLCRIISSDRSSLGVTVAYWDIAKKPLLGLGLLVSQVMIAAHRRDIPSLQNQDPSGIFGDGYSSRRRSSGCLVDSSGGLSLR